MELRDAFARYVYVVAGGRIGVWEITRVAGKGIWAVAVSLAGFVLVCVCECCEEEREEEGWVRGAEEGMHGLDDIQKMSN